MLWGNEMGTSPTNKATQFIQRALLSNELALTDGQLLERFIGHRDEAALESIIRRHGSMVWGVCRRLLSHHDAEDAFQATFLVLVRKAACVMPRELLPNWLYGVARQTALKTRATSAIRSGRERQVTQMPEPAAEQDTNRDLQPLLDQELSRLPDHHRVVIVLCDLEGRTRKEVACQLGLPEGTVASRLTRARAMLAKRFARHGVVMSVGALAGALSQATASACVPKSLVVSTIHMTAVMAGNGLAAGLISTRVAALTEGVVKAMFISKLKTLSTTMLALTLLAGGGGLLGYRALCAGPEATSREARPEERAGDERTAGQQDAAPENEPAPAQADDKAKADQAAEKFFHVDLQPKANQKLTDNFGSGTEGNNLAELPRGEQTFEKVKFKIGDGMLQLNSKLLKEQKAHIIEDIKVGQTFAKVHILQGTCYGNKDVEDGTVIGEYKLHYDDGSTETIPIVYGQDVRDFWLAEAAQGVTRGKVAWTGDNEVAKKFNCRIRLYLTTWDNPNPQKSVTRIDYNKLNGTQAAPFCVAITLQQQ